jgi:hypothetical protein
VPVESDADLLGMFDPAEFGVAAQWTQAGGGPPLSITVIPLQPEAVREAMEGARSVAIAASVRVPVAAVGGRMIRGDLLSFGGQAYRVAEVNQTDDGALLDVALRKA